MQARQARSRRPFHVVVVFGVFVLGLVALGLGHKGLAAEQMIWKGTKEMVPPIGFWCKQNDACAQGCCYVDVP